jgi:activator of 2-hydroxyglutaryl-CoA dehydratase
MKDTGCNNVSILGIDIGSISLSLAQIGKDGMLLKTAYVFHHGKIREVLMNLLTAIDLSVLSGIACTSASPDIINGAVLFDSQLALMAGTRHFYKRVGSILQVGGEKFSLLEFDDNGNYRGTMTNSSCAAGTGSFLDQQARRLNLGGVEKLCEMASSNRGDIPKIASRCAVFAKTDLIHAQQEGYRIEEICDGLCFGLAENIVDALFVEEGTQ